MTRRWTGWLAWGALALVIGVPSADLALKNSPNHVKTDSASAFIGDPNAQAGGEKATPITEADQQVAHVDPGQARVVGGAPIFKRAYSAEDVMGSKQVQASSGEKNVAAAVPTTIPADAEKPKPAITEIPEVVVIRGETPESTAPDEPMVASLEIPVSNSDAAQPTMVAPTPMPLSLRPKTPIMVSSVETQPSFDRPPVVAPTIQPMEPLPPMQPSGSIVVLPMADNPNYAADSPFYQSWVEPPRPLVGFRRHGSFEEQLPAQRGNGVRMDLLQ